MTIALTTINNFNSVLPKKVLKIKQFGISSGAVAPEPREGQKTVCYGISVLITSRDRTLHIR